LAQCAALVRAGALRRHGVVSRHRYRAPDAEHDSGGSRLARVAAGGRHGQQHVHKGGLTQRPGPLMFRVSLQENDVGGALFTGVLHDVELHALSLGHGAVIARRGERGEVYEHILASRLLLNEAVALRVVKPLDRPGHLLSFLPASQRHVERQSEGYPTDNGWTKLWSHTQRASIGARGVYHNHVRIDSDVARRGGYKGLTIVNSYHLLTKVIYSVYRSHQRERGRSIMTMKQVGEVWLSLQQ